MQLPDGFEPNALSATVVVNRAFLEVGRPVAYGKVPGVTLSIPGSPVWTSLSSAGGWPDGTWCPSLDLEVVLNAPSVLDAEREPDVGLEVSIGQGQEIWGVMGRVEAGLGDGPKQLRWEVDERLPDEAAASWAMLDIARKGMVEFASEMRERGIAVWWPEDLVPEVPAV